MRHTSRLAASIAGIVLFGTAVGADTINPCQAGKTACVAKAVGCLLGCHARALKVGALDGACVARCEQKFDGSLLVPPDATRGCIQKLQARGNCVTSDETTAMAAKIDGFVDDVVCDFDPSAAGCSAVTEPTPTAIATPVASPTPIIVTDTKRVFLSSSPFPATFGGVSGADAFCQTLADNAALGGTYRAWLSDGSQSPANRFTRSTAGYVLVDGTTSIASDWSDLTDGTIAASIVLSEAGGTPGGVAVWTATNAAGQSAGTSCLGWTSGNPFDTALVGIATSAEPAWWTQNETRACDDLAHLYCFEQ